jgi:hypothetical protein
MIKEAIEKIIDLASIQHESFIGDGDVYVKRGQNVQRLKQPDQHIPEELTFTTLTGLVDYIETNPDALEMSKLILHVAAADRVALVGPLQPSNDNIRFCYATASVTSANTAFQFGYWYQLEDFIIRLQADFARPEGIDDDADAIIELLGKVANENIQTNTDDGFSQTIQVRSGLTTNSTVKVENPVRVHPWRTFREVEQPEVLSVLRFKKSGRDNDLPVAALFEAGGGSWQLEAIKRVRAYLLEELSGFVKVLS